MHLCTETVTVFNHCLDRKTGDVEYIPTVITGVSWFDETLAQVNSQSGIDAASKITVRVPVDADFGNKSYTNPKAYQDAESPDGLFTFMPGDLLVKGSDSQSGQTLADLKRKHGRVVTILGVTDNRRAPNAKHWKVTGC